MELLKRDTVQIFDEGLGGCPLELPIFQIFVKFFVLSLWQLLQDPTEQGGREDDNQEEKGLTLQQKVLVLEILKSIITQMQRVLSKCEDQPICFCEYATEK